VTAREIRATLFSLALLLGGAAHAQFTWTGNGPNDNWNTANNWNPAGPPTAGANVAFTGASTPVMNVAATVGTVTKSGGGALTISGPNSLTINGGLTRTGGAINLNVNVVLGAGQTWTLSGGTTTVNGVLSGAALTRAGTGGNLVLANNNTFASLTINTNLVTVTASHALGNGAVTLAGGVLTLNSATALTLPNAVTATGTSRLNVNSSASARHVLNSLTTNGGITLTLAGNNQTTLAVTTLTTNGTLSTTTASPGIYVAGSLSATVPLIIRGAPANPNLTQQALGLHIITTIAAAAPIDGRGAAGNNSTILGADGAVAPTYAGQTIVADATSMTGRLVLTPRNGAVLTIGTGAQLLTANAGTGNPLQIRGDATGTVSFAAGFNALAGANGLDNVNLLGGGIWETNASINLPRSVTFSTAGSVWRTATNAQTFSGPVATNADVTINTVSNLTLTGVLSGGAGNLLTKLGAGTLTLANAANTHTGDLAVNAGTLSVTGALAATDIITINSGATVSGTGTTRNVTVANGGTYSPGVGGTGTLTTTGNLVLNNSSNVNFTVGSTSTRGVITGNLTLDGVINITAGPGLAPGSFPVFQVTGTITNNLPTFGPPPSGFNVGYRIVGNQVILDFIARPLSVKIASYSGTHDGISSRLTWRAGEELRTFGYRVWRQEGSNRRLVTNRLIEGSVLRASSDLANGHQYAFEDPSAPNGATYWVEALSVDGRSDWIGPVITRLGAPSSSARSPALLAVTSPARTAGGTARVVETPAAAALGAALDPQQAVLAASPAAKVAVLESGVYRVSAETLFSAGIPAGAAVASLQVWASARSVAFRVRSADGVHLNPGDALEFYGRGIDTRYSDTRTYWVTSGLGTARMIDTANGPTARAPGASFPESLEVREHGHYFSGLKNGLREKFFGPPVYSAPLVRTFSTAAIDLASNEPAQLRVALQGVTVDDHLVDVSVNGVGVGSMSWSGQTERAATFSIPHGLLVAGDNQVQVATRSDSDFSLEIFQQLTYPRLYQGLGGPLLFTAPGGSIVRLGGFTDGSVRIYDVTDVDSPLAVNLAADGSDPSLVKVDVPGSGSRILYAFADSDVKAPSSVRANAPSSWHSIEGADLIVIGHSTLLPALQSLTAQRTAEGLKVATIDVEDVYDEFSAGQKDAGAIRTFLRYALQTWERPPRYVLLVGNASFNPRNYPEFVSGPDLVPGLFVETTSMEVASDDEFVKAYGHASPSMAIGRLPFTRIDDVRSAVSKLLDRRLISSDAKLLFIHDRDEEANRFSGYIDTVKGAIPGRTASTLGRRTAVAPETQSDVDAALHSELLAALAEAPAVVTFLGHGEEPYWASPNVFSIADEAALVASGQTSVYFAGTCRNGWFTDMGYDDADILAASLLRANGGGAWAVWAASGDAPADDLPALVSGVLQGALLDGLTLGDATMRAKAAIQDPDVRAVFHLFGDPSARMTPAKGSTGLTSPVPGIKSSVATGCGTPGSTALAILPLVALALLLAARERRRGVVPARRKSS
jgi:autotransporter-associated beta strand protein